MTEVAITSRAREVREIELGEGSAPHAVIGQLLEHLDRYLAADTAASGDALKRGEPMPFLERVNEAPAAWRSGSRASSAALRRRARSRRGVVVVAARELDKHARLIPHAPGVVTRRQHHHVVGRELLLAAVIHDDVQPPGQDDGDVRQLAALRPGVGLEILRSARAGVEGHTGDADALERHRLLGGRAAPTSTPTCTYRSSPRTKLKRCDTPPPIARGGRG